MGRATVPAQKCLLIRELAWRTQERVSGGLDGQTKRLLTVAIRDAQLQRQRAVDQLDGGAPPEAAHDTITSRGNIATVRPSQRVQRNAADLSAIVAGTRLVRTWRGREHHVEVLPGEQGFRYQAQQYSSLSEIARVITGSRWSGPRFFGLTRRSGPSP